MRRERSCARWFACVLTTGLMIMAQGCGGDAQEASSPWALGEPGEHTTDMGDAPPDMAPPAPDMAQQQPDMAPPAGDTTFWYGEWRAGGCIDDAEYVAIGPRDRTTGTHSYTQVWLNANACVPPEQHGAFACRGEIRYGLVDEEHRLFGASATCTGDSPTQEPPRPGVAPARLAISGSHERWSAPDGTTRATWLVYHRGFSSDASEPFRRVYNVSRSFRITEPTDNGEPRVRMSEQTASFLVELTTSRVWPELTDGGEVEITVRLRGKGYADFRGQDDPPAEMDETLRFSGHVTVDGNNRTMLSLGLGDGVRWLETGQVRDLMQRHPRLAWVVPELLAANFTLGTTRGGIFLYGHGPINALSRAVEDQSPCARFASYWSHLQTPCIVE